MDVNKTKFVAFPIFIKKNLENFCQLPFRSQLLLTSLSKFISSERMRRNLGPTKIGPSTILLAEVDQRTKINTGWPPARRAGQPSIVYGAKGTEYRIFVHEAFRTEFRRLSILCSVVNQISVLWSCALPYAILSIPHDMIKAVTATDKGLAFQGPS